MCSLGRINSTDDYFFLNGNVFHLNESLPVSETNPASARGKGHLSGRSRQLSPEPVQSIPGLQGRAAGRTASAIQGLGSQLQPGGRERGWEGEGTKPGRPGSPPPPPRRGGARFPDNRARAQPSPVGRGGGRRGRGAKESPPHAHSPRRGGGGRGHHPGSAAAGPARPCPDHRVPRSRSLSS